jgi:hypothetical protein
MATTTMKSCHRYLCCPLRPQKVRGASHLRITGPSNESVVYHRHGYQVLHLDNHRSQLRHKSPPKVRIAIILNPTHYRPPPHLHPLLLQGVRNLIALNPHPLHKWDHKNAERRALPPRLHLRRPRRLQNRPQGRRRRKRRIDEALQIILNPQGTTLWMQYRRGHSLYPQTVTGMR